MPLIRTAPQRVEHTDGWAVESADREHVRYVEGDRSVLAGLDRGTDHARLHVYELEWAKEGREAQPLDPAEAQVVTDRLVEGVRGLGYAVVERYAGRSTAP